MSQVNWTLSRVKATEMLEVSIRTAIDNTTSTQLLADIKAMTTLKKLIIIVKEVSKGFLRSFNRLPLRQKYLK